VSDKPSAAWYLAPIFMGIVGSAIMWYVLKDEDHPDSPKMVRKGWVIGIVLTVISVGWIPFMLIPLAFIDDGESHLVHDPEIEQRMIPEPKVQPPPSMIKSFEECVAAGNPVMESYPRQCRTLDGKHFVESLSEQEQCEIAGGLWGIWGNISNLTNSCNPATSDAGMECSDSSQCQSFCQAKEGAQIGTEDTGMCYGYELAICLQEVRDGVVDPEWCQ